MKLIKNRTEQRRINFKLFGIWKKTFYNENFDSDFLIDYLIKENVRIINTPSDAKPMLGRYKSGKK